ncbi:NADH:flavin oxidoreductase/NADH oxidase [Salarchaeum japonicum]|nr:NADH:flavin oxidoreductase/NADH oxidase [Salarchaeum japonicum]
MTDDLFTPLELRETEIPNRLMLSPMCQYSCDGLDGLATEWHNVHLGTRAVGGAGLVMAEATAVEPRGRITPHDLGIWSEEHADALKRTTDFIESQGAVSGIQLAHAGRKASTHRPWADENGYVPIEDEGWEVVSATDEPYPYETDHPTHALTTDEVEGVVESFREAAEHALDAGFDVPEVHAAHGYLLHQFLSPVTNDRDDKYGGSFENRTRIVREVVEAVRDVYPDDKPVFVRISATDWIDDEPSWDVEQSTRLADQLSEAGADLIDVSTGGISPKQNIEWVGPNYQLRFAEHIRENKTSDIKIGSVGGITTPEQADALVRNDRVDLTIVGRKFLRDPYFGLHAAQELGQEDANRPPSQYLRGF